MLYIRTISDFNRLSGPQQVEILKSIRAKDRLEKWLWSLNNRSEREKPAKPEGEPPGWTRCKHCLKHVGWVPEEEQRDNRFIHPSGISKCVRYLWYMCNGYDKHQEEKVAPDLRMVFDIGHGIHHMLQRYGKAGAWGDCGYEPEVFIDPTSKNSDGTPADPVAAQFWLMGHIDAVLDHYYLPNVPGLGDVTIRIGHEYKSISMAGFEKLTRPKLEHRWQATLYSLAKDIPVFVYLYVNKNNSEMKDYPLPFDQSLWAEIYYEKIEPVQRLTVLQQPPEWSLTSAHKNTAECRQCPVRVTVCNPPLAEKK